jgi:hypothetical protein
VKEVTPSEKQKLWGKTFAQEVSSILHLNFFTREGEE